MSVKEYRVLYAGKILEGYSPERVKKNLSALFKLSDQALEKLFSGSRIVIKKSCDESSAIKYQSVFKKAGAECIIEEIVSHPSDNQIDTEGPGLSEATIAPPGSIITQPEQVPSPKIDTNHLSMGTAGEVIMEHHPVPIPEIDTSVYDIDPVGIDLTESRPAQSLEIDVNHLTISPAGENLVASEVVKEAEIDTSKLHLDDGQDV